MRYLETLLPCAVLIASTWHPAHAREPDRLDEVLREARIFADVVESALREQVGNQPRVTSVTAEFLAQQGILLNVNVAKPWFSVDSGDRSIQVDTEISLEEIPPLVSDILSELQIAIAPYQPDALDELRELRDEQRALRDEQRAIRRQLRSLRRDLVRSDSDDKKASISEEISELERELAAADAQYNALHNDIDNHYQDLRDYRTTTES